MGGILAPKIKTAASIPVPPPAATASTAAEAAPMASAGQKATGSNSRQRNAGKTNALNPTGAQGVTEKASTAKNSLLGQTNVGNPDA